MHSKKGNMIFQSHHYFSFDIYICIIGGDVVSVVVVGMSDI